MPRKPRTIMLRMTVGTAKRERKCKRSKAHTIPPGGHLLLVREPGPATGEQGYCPECAADMLAAARDQLDELEHGLRIPGSR